MNFKKLSKAILALIMALMMIIPTLSIAVSAVTYSGESSGFKNGKYGQALSKVTLTGDQRTDIVNIAKTQVGYQEGNSGQYSGTVRGSKNVTEYGRWYGLQDMWCAMFVSWCAMVAGVSESVVPKHCFTPTGLNWFKNKGQAYSRAQVASGKYTPQPGDIIYFKSSRNQNITNHVGIVTSYSGGTVYTVEGNTSSATVSTNGGAVAAKSYKISNTYIVYICKPAYTETTNLADAPTAGKAADVGDNFYAKIYHPKTNKNLSLMNTDVIAYPASDAPAQVWNFIRQSDNSYKIVNTKNGLCLDVSGATTGNGSGVCIYESNDKDNQRWFIVPKGDYYIIQPKNALGAALDVDSGNSQTVQIWNQSNNEQQNFKLNVVAGPYDDIGTDFYAKLQNVGSTKFIGVNGVNAAPQNRLESGSQIWKFTKNSDGSYAITNAQTLLNLEVKVAAATDGTQVITAKANSKNTQKWYVYSVDKGYIIRPACALKTALNVDTKKDFLHVLDCNAGTSQTFKITKTTYSGGSSSTEQVGSGREDFYSVISADDKSVALNTEKTAITLAATNTNDLTQLWHFVRVNNDAYKILNFETETALTFDVANAEASNLATVALQTNSDSQRWLLYEQKDGFSIHPAADSSYYLKTFPEENVIRLVKGDKTEAQVFELPITARKSQSIGENITSNIQYKLATLNLSFTDKNVVTSNVSDDDNQKWTFTLQSDGTYMIVNKSGNKYLNVSGDIANNADVVVGTDNAQRWCIYALNGGYIIQPANSTTFVLSVVGISSEASTGIKLAPCNGGASQIFTIANIAQ